MVLVLGYNIMLQYKVKVETAKKQEASRYLTIIDGTEELIGNAHHMPFSQDLLVCLNNRILDALENMYQLDPKNKQLAQRIESVKQQITQLKENYQGGESTAFRVPSTDKQAIMMLKLVKRLRDTVRNEHNKGRFETIQLIYHCISDALGLSTLSSTTDKPGWSPLSVGGASFFVSWFAPGFFRWLATGVGDLPLALLFFKHCGNKQVKWFVGVACRAVFNNGFYGRDLVFVDAVNHTIETPIFHRNVIGLSIFSQSLL